MPEPKPTIDDDDDYELELEPVDPEILAAERERGQQRTETAVGRIDVNEIYGDTGSYSDLELDLSGLRQFRFTTRHLLVLTAMLALVLTLFRLFHGNAIIVIGAVLLAGGYYWASRLERQREAERVRRREEFFGKTEAASAADEVIAETAPRASFKLAFTTKELLITMTAAAVALALLGWVGPDILTMVLGAVALIGLIANAVGYDPPRQLVFAWWILLMMYLLVGVYSLVAPGNGTADGRRNRPAPITAVVREVGCHGATA